MNKAILLQSLATESKNKRLDSFMNKAIEEYNRLLSAKWDLKNGDWCNTFMEFHKKTLLVSKINTSFNVQVRCSLIRDAWKKKGSRVNGLTVKFNIPRNCKTFSTKSNFFVRLSLYPKIRIPVPIKQNRNYQRFQSLLGSGWVCKTFGLTKDLQIVAYLSKEKIIEKRGNVLGIDVNAKHFAVSVVSPKGKVLYQTYLGKHIWIKRKKIIKRRALLQSINAKKKLERIKTYEKDFVKTNLGQVIREIIKIANRFNAEITIEKLNRFGRKGRRFNRTVMRIPFFKFRQILEQRCFDNNIPLNIVDSWHTSKWCTHCGAVGKGHSSNYSMFKCKCGQIVNSDRKASLAIAVKSLLEREDTTNPSVSIQISKWRATVNSLIRPSAVVGSCFVSHNHQPMESPHALAVGSLHNTVLLKHVN
ncbi:MAG: IS200/IS605 family element transposase accessory protein TnpB [Candidatus Aenigmarchaeota archaeon]|nr:IS200/IS605 family element transposase accessory protein TnpB [Candidatus Aenigmarchaeota archaeon]